MELLKQNIKGWVLAALVALGCLVGIIFYPSVIKAGNSSSTCTYNGVDYSKVYDVDYYYNNHADLRRVIGYNPTALLKHFVTCGMKEGRRASSNFDVKYYKENNADLQKAFGSDYASYYLHYINNGYKEGRLGANYSIYDGVDYSLVYNEKYYLENYADLQKVFGDNPEALIKHFVTCGMAEGRVACSTFDVKYYKSKYADLQKVFGSDLTKYYKHYIENGYKEGRIAYSSSVCNGVDYSYVYDMDYYYNKYSDLQKAIGYDRVKLLKHFITCGMKEGRQGRASFDVKYYKNKYTDLQKAFGTNLKQYYIHYMNYGYKEGRQGSAVSAPNFNNVTNGWLDTGSAKYYYCNGKPLTGWQVIEDRKYYFNNSGVLKSKLGIDVSRHNGTIDWQKVANDGIEFAIIRVGYGDNLTNQDDSTAVYNIQQCQKYGIPYGVYIYSYALTADQINSEVQHTLRMIKGYSPSMGVYIDMEDQSQQNGCTSDQLNAFAKSYMTQITNAGYKAGVYANRYWLTSILTDNSINNYLVWIANYGISDNAAPNYSKKYEMWQYSDAGTVDGISTKVDMDVYLVS